MSAREFFHFYQTDTQQKWKAVAEAGKGKKELGAKRVSILAASSPEIDSSNRDNIYYKGPFYVDIDRKDLRESIYSAKRLLSRIREWAVPDGSYQIFCSGSKGFHFYFHPKLFYSARPHKKLPEIYKRLACDFYVPGLDYAVYCGGKGNLFWIPNVRKDDGTYKTQITPEELETFTPDDYRRKTSVQSLIDPPQLVAPNDVNPTLYGFFQEAEEFVEKKQTKKDEEPLSETVFSVVASEPPPCVSCLANGEVRNGSNFNQVAFQMAAYLKDAKIDPGRSGALISRMAEKVPSAKYPHTEDRVAHAEGLLEYLKTSTDKRFSCQAMRAVLSYRPCKECPVEELVLAEAADCYDIEERKDGYYSVKGRTATRITSFVLIPYRTIYSEDPADRALRRSYLLCGIEQMGELLPQYARLTEEAWLSRGNFVKEFQGISNLRVTATDNEIQALKHWVMRDTEKITDQIEANEVGIHANMIKGHLRFTYVEDGYSVNKFGIPDTHTYPSQASYDSRALPRLRNVSTPDKARFDYESMLTDLMGLNIPQAMAPLIGWLSACHLKSHFVHAFGEFPLFSLWGGRGSGKTKTACVVTSSLHACNYVQFPPVSVGRATPFAVIDTITSTRTVPRVLDEFNRHGCRHGFYDELTEYFKDAYNGAAIAKGRLTRPGEVGRRGIGATTDYFFVTSPLLLLSEHALESPALLDRTFLTMLREPDIEGRQERMYNVTGLQLRFREIAKALVLAALQMRVEVLRDLYDGWKGKIHPQYTERQAHTRKVIGIGLDVFENVMVDGLKLDIREPIAELKAAYLEQVKTFESVSSHAGYQTEIDRIIMMLGTYITLHKRTGTITAIPRGMYEIDQGRDALFLDIPVTYTVLEDHAATRRQILPIRQPQQFQRILASEKYFVGMEYRDSMTLVRPVACLSLSELHKKGIDVTMFFG